MTEPDEPEFQTALEMYRDDENDRDRRVRCYAGP